MSHVSIAAFAVLSLVSAACAPGTAAIRAGEPPRPAPSELPTIAVTYEVTRSGSSDGVILAGHADAEPRHTIAVAQQAGRTPEKQELKLVANPRADGTVVVEVRYAEVSAEGAHISWEPTVHVTRGIDAVAEIKGPGWGRSIRLRLL